jgi:hypothetical protein
MVMIHIFPGLLNVMIYKYTVVLGIIQSLDACTPHRIIHIVTHSSVYHKVWTHAGPGVLQ